MVSLIDFKVKEFRFLQNLKISKETLSLIAALRLFYVLVVF